MVAVPVPSTDLPYPAPPALRVAETLQFSPELMARMPITASVAQHLDANAFADALVIHTNHLLDDVLLLNEVFVQLGAEMVFIPVMYGEKTLPAHVPYDLMYPRVENGEVVIYRNGEAVSKAPTNLDNGVQAAIVEAFRHYAMHTQRKILVLEDGGYHYEMLEYIKPLVSRRSPGIVAAVEQTRKGLRNAEAHLARANGNHHYPVLSVARSKLKTRFENQFIAQRVIEETTLMLYLLDEFLTYRDVLLLGYGVIGRPMAMIARNMGCRVFVRDTDLTVQRAALRDGFGVGSAVSPELFTGMPIVMGTTGVPSFTLPMFEQYLKSAAPRLYLVSASSGRIEFSHLIKFFEGTPQERLALAREFPFLGRIEDISVEFVNKVYMYRFTYYGEQREVVLLGEGYPVNFYRPDSQSLPAKIIDPINAEILVLAEYGLKHGRLLQPGAYLLGRDELPNLTISEEDILRLWGAHNHIAALNHESSVWYTFEPHPCEERLCANGRAKVSEAGKAHQPARLHELAFARTPRLAGQLVQ